MININKFLQGYINAALWSTIDSYGYSNHVYTLDDEFSDFSENCRNAMLEDCKDFIESNRLKLIEFKKLAQCNDYRLGFLFWVNRNGHGTGYWDEIPNYPVGDELSAASRDYGSFYLYGDFEEGVVKSHHYG